MYKINLLFFFARHNTSSNKTTIPYLIALSQHNQNLSLYTSEISETF